MINLLRRFSSEKSMAPQTNRCECGSRLFQYATRRRSDVTIRYYECRACFRTIKTEERVVSLESTQSLQSAVSAGAGILEQR